MKNKKLVIIGAGSAYSPEIFDGLISRSASMGIDRITLVDIEAGMPQAEIIENFGKRMFEKGNLSCEIELTENRRYALENADCVISQIRVGSWQARAADERLGLELGLIGQETTGAGGFVNAMRTIPVALEIARDIEEICPNAWLINFTNPSGIVTEAVLKHSRVKCIGLCNVPINMQNDAEKLLDVSRMDMRYTFMGLNHLGFMTAATHCGNDVLPLLVEKIGGNETLMKNIPKVAGAGDLIKAIGILPSPYLQYYYFENEMRKKQQNELADSGLTRGDIAHKIDLTLFEKYANHGLCEKPGELSERGGSLYSYAALNIIEALFDDEGSDMVVNIQNQGAVSDLADSDVVEVSCHVSSSGVKRLPLGPLPEQVSGLVQTIKQYERLTVSAAVKQSRTLSVQALLNHPLIHGYHNAKRIVEEMERQFPQYISLRN